MSADAGGKGDSSSTCARREKVKSAVMEGGEDALLKLWWAAEKAQAALTAAMAQHVHLAESLARSDTDYAREAEVRLTSTSLAVGSRNSDLTMANRLHEAAALQERLPRVLAAWVAGELHRGHVRAIERHSFTLTGDDLASYEAEVLTKIGKRTPRQLGPIAARIARRFAPEPLRKRFESAFAKRGVWVSPAEDGTSVLSILTASALAEAALNRLHQGAKAQERGGETTLQQWMADAAMAHLITGTTATADGTGGLLDGIAAKVVVTMPATLLACDDTSEQLPATGPAQREACTGVADQRGRAGDDGRTDAVARGGPRPGEPDAPADRVGVGLADQVGQGDRAGRGDHGDPGVAGGSAGLVGLQAAGWCHFGDGHAELRSGALVDDDTARLLVGRCVELVRLFTDPITGIPVWVDRHDPSANQRRAVMHRDQTCRFPGCGAQAEWCDIDHTRRHSEGGQTCLCNLGCLCRRHHGLKHLLGDSGWTVAQPRPGVFVWTSPTGRLYLTEPEPSPAAIIKKPPEKTRFYDDDPPPF